MTEVTVKTLINSAAGGKNGEPDQNKVLSEDF